MYEPFVKFVSVLILVPLRNGFMNQYNLIHLCFSKVIVLFLIRYKV